MSDPTPVQPQNEPERMDQVTANQVGSGAPGTLTLKGEVYLVGQPTRANWVTLKKFLTDLWKKQHGNVLQDTLKDLAGIDPQYHALVIKEAVGLKQNLEPTAENLNELFITAEATRFWFWLLTRPNHPELTQEKVKTLIDEQNLSPVLADMLSATDMTKVQPSKN